MDDRLILPRVACTSRDELTSKLLEKIYSINSDLPLIHDDVLHAISMREQIGGTLLPSGLAVPHARLKNFEGFILAFGTPAEPLIHEGIEIRLMALMISSQSGVPWYLQVLAELTKLSRDGSFLSRLSAAETPAEFMSVFHERDPEIA